MWSLPSVPWDRSACAPWMGIPLWMVVIRRVALQQFPNLATFCMIFVDRLKIAKYRLKLGGEKIGNSSIKKLVGHVYIHDR